MAVRGVSAVGPLFILVVLTSPIGSGADAGSTHVDWQRGSSLVGLHGIGNEAINEPRYTFDVGPCHRDLRLDLLYRPDSTWHEEESDPHIPYVFGVAVHDATGASLSERSIADPGYGYRLGTLPAAGTYEVRIRLDVGAMVDWDVRLRGWTTHGEPSCELFLNEVETDPDGLGQEWVEVYNRGAQPFDISGWTIWGKSLEDTADVVPHVVANNTTLDAGAHLRIYLQDGTSLGDVNETVVLADPHGRPVDLSAVLTDPAGDIRTWSRTSDGAASWTFGAATPGAPNDP